jgi:hypothetical protein
VTRDSQTAETIAITALGFIAADGTLLNRFIGVTGIEPGQIRAAASEPGFLAGVLDFVLAHEPTLIAFAEQAELDPATIARARQALPNGSDEYDRST